MADDTGQGLRPAGLAEVPRQARSQAGKTPARPAPVAWHVGADQQPAADVNRLPHHARRLPAAGGGQPGGVSVLRLGLVDRGPVKAERVQALQADFEGLLRRFNEVMAWSRANREQIRRGRSRREILHVSTFARLQARMATMPVIERAKGIIMAQRRCGPEEAFDLLSRASQRANVKVHVLAAQIVESVAGPLVGALGAGRYARR